MLPLILLLQSLSALEPVGEEGGGGAAPRGAIMSPGGFTLGLRADVRARDLNGTLLASNSGPHSSPATKTLATSHKSG